MNSQTVTVDNFTLGALATYTFTYVTTSAIGVGTDTPNIIYLVTPSGYSAFATFSPLSTFAPHAVVKVNDVEIPINATNFGEVGGSWSSGVQISTGGATGGTAIPAGATIKISVSNIITNPLTASNYTFNWKTAEGSGSATQSYEANIDFSVLSIKDLVYNNINIFPNPSSDFIKISGLTKKENYKIYNVLGREISSGVVFDRGISIQNLTNGLYILKFDNRNSMKFVKE